ncbi:MAG: hypothetical protein WB756_09590 [Xanthobacteraceae bacterium]
MLALTFAYPVAAHDHRWQLSGKPHRLSGTASSGRPLDVDKEIWIDEGRRGLPLQPESGPDDWQEDILVTIAEGLSPQRALQIAVASGHGPGKTALVAWIILWAMLTEADTRGW